MRLGAISDVHANEVALDAVLDDLPDDVDRLVCAGDVVGYNPWPETCIDRVREECETVVQGNHDRAVANGDSFNFNSLADAAVRYTRDLLDDDRLRWLRTLPTDRTIPVGDREVRIVHGHPDAPDRYTYPSEFTPSLLSRETTSDRSYDRVRDRVRDRDRDRGVDNEGDPLDEGDPDVLVLGHTHIQAHSTFEEGIVLNPGSVGQPRDGDPRAAYSVIDIDEMAVEERRVEYDIERVVAAIEDAGLPRQLGARLHEGH